MPNMYTSIRDITELNADRADARVPRLFGLQYAFHPPYGLPCRGRWVYLLAPLTRPHQDNIDINTDISGLLCSRTSVTIAEVTPTIQPSLRYSSNMVPTVRAELPGATYCLIPLHFDIIAMLPSTVSDLPATWYPACSMLRWPRRVICPQIPVYFTPTYNFPYPK